ncbi:hypothetical protein SDC9_202411 [bioreactor metagenome]|uniref:Uncharacterized protein n=1 Tax=bioreactor metagenome TaxID=1076179 RepID=A0A645J2P1_9ZZZZ
MVVTAGQQCGPRGRTQAGSVEIGIAQTICGQLTDTRRLDRPAITGQMAEAQVVEQDHHDIRSILWWPDRARPFGLRFLVRVAYDATERRIGRRKNVLMRVRSKRALILGSWGCHGHLQK